MATKVFVAVGVFPVELLACQVSMICAANWVRRLFVMSNTKYHEHHYVGELDNPHLHSLRWISSACTFSFNYPEHTILQGIVSFASAQAKLMHA